MENTKRCSKCGRELPLECFGKHKRKKDGLQAYCKECMKQYMKEYNADNADERKQYFKQLYSTIEGYARMIRWTNLQNDRKYGRISKDEDPLPPLEQYIELLQQPDYYDGKQYSFNEMGLDRVDNSKPHTLDNVVPCTTEHNKQRHTMPFEEFCELMRKENELELVL